MEFNQYFIYLLIMAGSTYLIRVIPFVAVKKKVENRFIKSFLYYIPYTVLTAMTFPAVIYGTDYRISAICGFLAAVIAAYKGAGLTKVAVIACVTVFLMEQIIVTIG